VDLVSEISHSVFGSKDLCRIETEDRVLQRAGEKVVLELVSGRYDEGLAAAVGGNVGS
jgi:hypothetical protein